MSRAIGEILRRYRRLFLVLFDMAAVAASYIGTWMLTLQGSDLLGDSMVGMAVMTSPYKKYFSLMASSCFLFVSCYIIIYAFMGMYDSLWRYAEIIEFFRVCVASFLAVAAFVTLSQLIFTERRIPMAVYLMSAMFATILTLMARLTYRMYRNTKIKSSRKQRRRVLLIGAGDAASMLLHEINRNPSDEMNIICAVDDSPQKVGRTILGVQIMGTTADIPDLVERCEIETILLCIPTIEENDKRRILSICSKTNCNLRIMPDLVKLIADGRDLSSRIRDVKVEDLLGREVIEMDPATNTLISGKVVMVTGGGGSIGSELCRQIAAAGPSKLVIVDIYENNAYSIQQELIRKYADRLDLEVQIASVRDSKKVDRLFAEYRPALVFHAAAHKHVPLMETSPEEAVKNNVFGTYNVALSAEKYGAERFVLISTDKAVNPTNVMGATKRICEMIVQTIAETSKTDFVAVRFGNVLGSNGSVLPLFKEQIAEGGPLTVTDPDIVRYFMTIPEAVSLVLQAASMSGKGNIFVLDMGEPVRILDLAENLIKLAGFIPYRDVDIVFTGLRPGEKLFEELTMDEESVHKTANKKIFVGAPLKMDKPNFFTHLARLKEIAYSNDSKRLLAFISEMVPTFDHEI
ncbi:polysaccharide biosynthesis protein [Anaerofilum sp. BX8]|uniref:Polysaccharide biosynthesis protein n=1 Tax=Anaerofilum hominis TaxID=2763016 RepID=A0A923L1N9_9FIRM|nr:nucleoside-diphosphate sugar epimerase/dehydratase [Anaerofilum hominis]MBC5582098.1 polysaccharide biosynthesis protein [Anaerofilum hominis]